MTAHTGTNASISTTATTRAGTAIDLTSPCSRRNQTPASGESRMSMRDESDPRRARHRSRCARHRGALPRVIRDRSQRTPPPSPERDQRFAAGAACRLRRHRSLRVTAGGADQTLGERITDQHRRARTGLLRAGPHTWPLPRSVPGRMPVDASPPLQGTTWRRPIGRRSRHRLGRLVSDRPPVTLHPFAPSW